MSSRVHLQWICENETRPRILFGGDGAKYIRVLCIRCMDVHAERRRASSLMRSGINGHNEELFKVASIVTTTSLSHSC